MERCLDVHKFHYVEGDIDSLYFAISGHKDEGINQGFKHIITDEKFYNENIYKWLPSDFYSSDNSNPVFDNAIDKMKNDKKLLGFDSEKTSECMIALAPKMYITFNPYKIQSLKMKGLSIKQTDINNYHYYIF
jgi:hypothetical protein